MSALVERSLAEVNAERDALYEKYRALVRRVGDMAQGFTVEIDGIAGNLFVRLQAVNNALDMADCVALMRGRFVRREGREYHAYVQDADKARPDDALLAQLYDEAFNIEGNMRAWNMLNCPSCNGCAWTK